MNPNDALSRNPGAEHCRIRHRRCLAWAKAPYALVVLVMFVACAEPATSPDVLLITLDATRLDSLGCYGGLLAETPHLDSLARVSLRFNQAITTAPYTGPSHASILTGLFPPRHGLRDFLEQALPESVVTLAEVLGDAGYATGAFVSAYVLDPRYGLDQGFEVYSSPAPPTRPFEVPERPAGTTVAEAIAWLEGVERPFFLWVHLFDPHFPYAPPAPFGELAEAAKLGPRQRQRRLYYREATYMDAEIGHLFAALRARDLYEQLVVIAVADHGELLGEPGRRLGTHSTHLVDTTIRVPLLVRVPGRGPDVVKHQVSVVDIFPTVLDALRLPAREDIDGTSLLALDSPVLRRTAYAETFYEHFPKRAQVGEELAAVRVEGWKLVTRPGREELFDLRNDPDERSNLASGHPKQVASLRAALDRLMARWPSAATARGLELSEGEAEDHIERLRALGYAE